MKAAERIEIARAITQESSRLAAFEQWKVPLIEQMKTVRTLRSAKAIARQLHCKDWPPDMKPRGCGCIGCRAYVVLDGGSIIPDPRNRCLSNST